MAKATTRAGRRGPGARKDRGSLKRKAVTRVHKTRPKVSSRSLGGVPVSPDDALEPLRLIARQEVEKGRISGVAACVLFDGKARFVEEAGYADVASKTPFSTTSVCRMYSMTKCLVAAAVMQLVERGQLGLDDKLEDHLPAFKSMQVLVEGDDLFPKPGVTEAAKRPILIRHLLTHTSGISGGSAPGIDQLRRWRKKDHAWMGIYRPLVQGVDRGAFEDLGAWVEALSKLPLWNHPGDFYGYGYSYDVLGHIVELKSGVTLQRYLQKHILDPLGMSDTKFDLASGKGTARRLASMYRRTKSSKFGADGQHLKLVRVDPPPKSTKSLWAKPCKLPSGGGALGSFEGGILSSLDDYAKFLLAIACGGAHPTTGARILSRRMASEMLADQTAALKRPPPSASPYNDRGLGLSCLGELQRKRAPNWGSWFDGAEGVRLWGGAASTAFKLDMNGGRPILAMAFMQTIPQDDGATLTAMLRAAREVLPKGSKAA